MRVSSSYEVRYPDSRRVESVGGQSEVKVSERSGFSGS